MGEETKLLVNAQNRQRENHTLKTGNHIITPHPALLSPSPALTFTSLQSSDPSPSPSLSLWFSNQHYYFSSRTQPSFQSRHPLSLSLSISLALFLLCPTFAFVPLHSRHIFQPFDTWVNGERRMYSLSVRRFIKFKKGVSMSSKLGSQCWVILYSLYPSQTPHNLIVVSPVKPFIVFRFYPLLMPQNSNRVIRLSQNSHSQIWRQKILSCWQLGRSMHT